MGSSEISPSTFDIRPTRRLPRTFQQVWRRGVGMTYSPDLLVHDRYNCGIRSGPRRCSVVFELMRSVIPG